MEKDKTSMGHIPNDSYLRYKLANDVKWLIEVSIEQEAIKITE